MFAVINTLYLYIIIEIILQSSASTSKALVQYECISHVFKSSTKINYILPLLCRFLKIKSRMSKLFFIGWVLGLEGGGDRNLDMGVMFFVKGGGDSKLSILNLIFLLEDKMSYSSKIF